MTSLPGGTIVLRPATYWLDCIDESGEKRRFQLPREVAAYMREERERTDELVHALERIASNLGRGGPRPNHDSDPLRLEASAALRAYRDSAQCAEFPKEPKP